jgi:hypothetical protein
MLPSLILTLALPFNFRQRPLPNFLRKKGRILMLFPAAIISISVI